jgi:hypothetical protein
MSNAAPPSRPGFCNAPRVARGTLIARVLVGPEKKEFRIHKNLLVAASPFFKEALNGRFAEAGSQQVSLPEHDPETFELFCDWLYAGTLVSDCRSLSIIRQELPADMCWLMVFQLADSLMIPGLQLEAYNRITSLFNRPSNLSSSGSNNVRMPTKDFLSSLFGEGYPLALQMHVVEHVAYFLPKSANETDWAANFTAHDRYGTEVAMVIVRSHTKHTFLHASQQASFAENHGFDLSALEAQARAADEKPSDVATEKMMRMFSPTSHQRCYEKADM